MDTPGNFHLVDDDGELLGDHVGQPHVAEPVVELSASKTSDPSGSGSSSSSSSGDTTSSSSSDSESESVDPSSSASVSPVPEMTPAADAEPDADPSNKDDRASPSPRTTFMIGDWL